MQGLVCDIPVHKPDIFYPSAIISADDVSIYKLLV